MTGPTRWVPGLKTVVEMDADARPLDAKNTAANFGRIEQFPVLLQFDFAAAFPSLVHFFISAF